MSPYRVSLSDRLKSLSVHYYDYYYRLCIVPKLNVDKEIRHNRGKVKVKV